MKTKLSTQFTLDQVKALVLDWINDADIYEGRSLDDLATELREAPSWQDIIEVLCSCGFDPEDASDCLLNALIWQPEHIKGWVYQPWGKRNVIKVWYWSQTHPGASYAKFFWPS